MNKAVFVLTLVIAIFFSSCASTINYKIDKEIDQEKYIQEQNNKIPSNSSIIIVGALANKETRYFVKHLEEKLIKSNFFTVISSNIISSEYLSYPCNIVSPDIEKERDKEIMGVISPGYETYDNKKIEEIGKILNVDYVFMTYMENTYKQMASQQPQGILVSKYVVGLLYRVKGTLWDIRNNRSIGESYFYISDSKVMKSGLLGDNMYSKTEELIESISKEAANNVAKRIIKENK